MYIQVTSQRGREREGEKRRLLISDILAGYFVSYFEASHDPFLCSKGELAIAIAVCFSFFILLFFLFYRLAR